MNCTRAEPGQPPRGGRERRPNTGPAHVGHSWEEIRGMKVFPSCLFRKKVTVALFEGDAVHFPTYPLKGGLYSFK